MGSKDGSSVAVAPQDGGMTREAVLDDEPVTGGRSGAVTGLGSVATSRPLTPQTAAAPTPLNTLSDRVPRTMLTPS